MVGDLEKSGLDLQTAIFKLNEFLHLDQELPSEAVSNGDGQAAANDAALLELQGMLKGVT